MSNAVSGRPDEAVYPAWSRPHGLLALVIFAVIAGGAALLVFLETGLGIRITAFAAEIGTRFGAGGLNRLQLALLLGLVAVLSGVCAVTVWYGWLRWVTVSGDGIRWWRGGKTYFRRWDEVTEVRHVKYQVMRTVEPVYWVEVYFRAGPHLHISDGLLKDYEPLVAEITARSQRPLVPGRVRRLIE